MSYFLVKKVTDFLASRLKEEKAPLLLALSGGNDSLALFFLLLEVQKKIPFKFHVAHVDHAWRQESQKETKALKKLVRFFSLPFHQQRLPSLKGPNLEARYRHLRYQYFCALQEVWHFKALLLAHHRDDQAETVFKRVCEGSGVKGLVGMRQERTQDVLVLWRPLLDVPKEMLKNYLKEQRVYPFFDKTNYDLHYLRPRMRHQIFPFLEEKFGKNLKANFCYLGSLFCDLESYFQEKVKEIEKKLIQGFFGHYLEKPEQFKKLELRFFLEERLRKAKGNLSRSSLDNLIELIKSRATKAIFQAKTLTFALNRSYLFILHEPILKFEITQWKQTKKKGISWKEFWQGEIFVPPKNTKILFLNELDLSLRKKVKKWYFKAHIPPFFHDKAPLFVSEDRQIKECLSGKDLSIP